MSGYVTAFSNAVRSGLNGELAVMLAGKHRADNESPQSMSLSGAISYHLDNWSFRSKAGGYQSLRDVSHERRLHDGAHLLRAFSLCALNPSRIVEPSEYQGSYEGELFVSSIQLMLSEMVFRDKPSLEPEDFYQKAIDQHKSGYQFETTGRVMRWKIAQIRYERGIRTGLAPHEINREVKFQSNPLKDLALKEGCKISKWEGIDVIRSKDLGRPYRIGPLGYEHEHLPQGSNGVEMFKPYRVPSETESNDIYRCILASMELFRGTDIFSVLMSDIFNVMKQAATPPKQAAALTPL